MSYTDELLVTLAARIDELTEQVDRLEAARTILLYGPPPARAAKPAPQPKPATNVVRLLPAPPARRAVGPRAAVDDVFALVVTGVETATAVASELGVSMGSVRQRIRELNHDGLIERGEGRAWHPTIKGRSLNWPENRARELAAANA